MEASFEGRQGTEESVARYVDEWSLWIGVLIRLCLIMWK